MKLMTQPNQYRVTIIGCGKMGAALIQGWVDTNLIKHAEIIDPSGLPDSLIGCHNLFHVEQIEESKLTRTDIVILCVKPQIMDIICAGLKDHLPTNVPLLSIAAGKDTTYFEQKFSPDTPIIRVMPNLPATIGKGMSAIYANKHVSEAQKDVAHDLFNAAGEVLWLEDEEQMDAVTALSGSGPAYLFHLIETMTDAGEKIGLSPQQATLLARQTVIGASALVEASPEIPAAILRENVTSKGGTTEAALKTLMDGRFQVIMDETLIAARDRSKKLAD
jgi:pyrroline-5-carboxylate reductase